jgi:hypothetical protein
VIPPLSQYAYSSSISTGALMYPFAAYSFELSYWDI